MSAVFGSQPSDAGEASVAVHVATLITLDIKKIPQDMIHVPPQLVLRSAHKCCS
jgi:hypothetical protein